MAAAVAKAEPASFASSSGSLSRSRRQMRRPSTRRSSPNPSAGPLATASYSTTCRNSCECSSTRSRQSSSAHHKQGLSAASTVANGQTRAVQALLPQSLNPSHFDDINLAIRAFDEQQTQFGSRGGAPLSSSRRRWRATTPTFARRVRASSRRSRAPASYLSRPFFASALSASTLTCRRCRA